MSPSTLAERVRANGKSRSPVQDTVAGLYDTITTARLEGCSWRDLHAQLTREGHRVGKNHNSLFTAYHAVKSRRASDTGAESQVVSTAGAQPSAPVRPLDPAAGHSQELPTLVVDSRRRTTDWGKHHDD